MKNILMPVVICSLFFAFTSVLGQSPFNFKYQSMLRKNDGSALANQPVKVRMSILKGTITGSVVYSEIHSTSTNSFGIINLTIGLGDNKSGSLLNIDWSGDSFFIKTETDEMGGNNYALSGTSQLLSVPYALHANSVTSVDWSKVTNTPVIPTSTNQLINNSGFIVSEVDGNSSNELQNFKVSTFGDTLYLSKSNFVIIPGISKANPGPVVITDQDTSWGNLQSYSTKINLAAIMSPSPLLDTNTFVLDPGCDITKLSLDARNVYNDEAVGGSSAASIAISMQVLKKLTNASLTHKGTSVGYIDPGGKKTDFVVTITEQKVGVSVTRAIAFPGGTVFSPASASTLLTRKLEEIASSSQNVLTPFRWKKQVLCVLTGSNEIKNTLVSQLATISPVILADTIVLIIVTDGDDVCIY